MPPQRASLAPLTTKPVNPVITHSSRFGEGYGDFVMQSNDGVLFHFPKVLLQYASPFFKDMFSISEHAREPITLRNDEPVVMAENSVTLDNILQWIDPAQGIPVIDPSTIANFLQAAHKYQLGKAIEWVTNMMTVGQGTSGTVKGLQCLLSTEPMLVLSLAEHYNLSEPARITLRQLITEKVETLFAENATISARLLLHLLRLRKQRTEWFLSCIDKVSDDPDRDKLCKSCSSCLMAWTRLVHSAPCWRSIEQYTPKYTLHCQNCTRINPNSGAPSAFGGGASFGAQGFGFGMRATSFGTQPTALGAQETLFGAQSIRVAPLNMALWETEAKQLEEQLPELPKGIFSDDLG